MSFPLGFDIAFIITHHHLLNCFVCVLTFSCFTCSKCLFSFSLSLFLLPHPLKLILSPPKEIAWLLNLLLRALITEACEAMEDKKERESWKAGRGYSLSTAGNPSDLLLVCASSAPMDEVLNERKFGKLYLITPDNEDDE